MFSKSTWLHLRIPFSFFLMPVYLFAVGISPNFSESRLIWSFVSIHFFLYPASNGYNSYFDKDEKSIGGLSNPPPVTRGLYYMSLLFDVIAIAIGAVMINYLFATMLLIYGLASKAYSHPSIRLKRFPLGGLFTVAFFQGFFTFLMCYVGINNFGLENLFNLRVTIPAALSSLLLIGTYPMTQIYQHDEDSARGDRTVSLWLGIRGTFVFVLIVFCISTIGYVLYFTKFSSSRYGLDFVLFLLPVVIYFLIWFYRVMREPRQANHRNTMRLNLISAICLNAFFIYFFLDSSQVLQAIQGGY